MAVPVGVAVGVCVGIAVAVGVNGTQSTPAEQAAFATMTPGATQLTGPD